ncbi:MAG: Smr/MutS family protein [Prevotellaceae bacterium]|nr:Smr/MutS family protein [Prevotellaceae bacterium]
MLFPESIEDKIGFSEIRTLLKGHCISKLGIERVESMCFMTELAPVRQALDRLADMTRLLDTEEQLPGEDFFDLRPSIRKLRVEGVYLEEQELWEFKRSLDTLHSWIALIRTEEHPYSQLEQMADGVFTFLKVTDSIDAILDKYGHIKDSASPELAKIRLELHRSEGSVNRTLVNILEKAKSEGLVESHVMPTMRDGRLMIPISPALKRRIRGIVHDESASGKTVFIEPAEVVEANNHIRELEAEERREVIRILQDFTGTLRPFQPEFSRAVEFLADVEFVLAKTHLAEQLDAVIPNTNPTPMIDWTLARHPLLERNLRRQGGKVVPLEITLTRQRRILVISGPNAGGKSVCLKTVGLLQYMLQCGLPIPVGENSQTGIFNDIFIDIGDEQSIDNDLSTYSGHLLNMKVMMKNCTPASLLLIDEFGAGTEPTIGGAIAEAVLKRFVQRGTFGVITTHYQNLKQFAEQAEGVVNGAMLYDRHEMRALFQLQIGNPGSSFAVEIARKMGIPEDVIADASDIVGKEYVSADKYLLDIVRDKRYWEGKRQTIHNREREMEQTIGQYEREIADLRLKRKEIIRNAMEQAEQILSESNARIENTIREIREANAEKERTRAIRKQLEDYKSSLQADTLVEQDESIERKMRQIEERRKRKEEKRSKKGTAAVPESGNSTATARKQNEEPETAMAVGSTVRIKGQTSVGTLLSISGKRATVLFGLMRTIVDLRRLEPAEPPAEEAKDTTAATLGVRAVSRQTQEQMHKTQMSFSPEIDIRGFRGEEALRVITHYVDDAILVGAARVRILHGTGTGALREIIRQYLNTVPQVSSARDEHVQFGGAGITVVEFTY